MNLGIVIVSHSKDIAKGTFDLIQEVAKDVLIGYAGGTTDGLIGTSFDEILDVINTHPAQKILAFFDLGSARMNINLTQEMTDKEVIVFNVPLVEGAYVAAALMQAGASFDEIKHQLDELEIIK